MSLIEKTSENIETDLRIYVKFPEIDLTEFSIKVKEKTYQAKGKIALRDKNKNGVLANVYVYIFIEGELPYPASEMRRTHPYDPKITTRYIYLPVSSMDRYINMVMLAKEKTLIAGHPTNQDDIRQYPIFWRSEGYVFPTPHINEDIQNSISLPNISHLKAKL